MSAKYCLKGKSKHPVYSGFSEIHRVFAWFNFTANGGSSKAVLPARVSHVLAKRGGVKLRTTAKQVG